MMVIASLYVTLLPGFRLDIVSSLLLYLCFIIFIHSRKVLDFIPLFTLIQFDN